MKILKTALSVCLLLTTLNCFADTYPVVRKSTPFKGSRFYAPNDEQPHTSIVMLHGSEGGSEYFLDAEANILATQGFSVLFLCYFDCGRGMTGPRQALKDVEATLVLKAVEWLRSLPSSNNIVAVYGFSRGGELTMLVGGMKASASQMPNALIAHAGSDVQNGPYSVDWQNHLCWLCLAGPGQCTKDSPLSAFTWNYSCGPDNPRLIDRSLSAWKIEGQQAKVGTRIAIESFNGPVLLTVGEADQVWPADQTRRLETTLKAAGRTPEVHYFPNADHVFFGPDELRRRELVLGFLKRLDK